MTKSAELTSKSKDLDLQPFGISVAVSSVGMAEAFYTRLFRTAPDRRYSNWIEYELQDGIRFCLKEDTVAKATKGLAPRVIFEVENLEATQKALEAEGFEFDEKFGTTEDYGRFSNLVDLDGNLIGFYEPEKD